MTSRCGLVHPRPSPQSSPLPRDRLRYTKRNSPALGLAEKLVAIVPPPRVYTVIYSGVLAANAALRPEVIPKVPTSSDAEQAAREARTLKRRDGPTPSLRAQLTLS